MDLREILAGGGSVTEIKASEPKPPSRSKSSDCFVPPPRREGRGPGVGGVDGAEGKAVACRGVPKRSFSFSDRAICARENGGQGEWAGPKQQGRRGDGPGTSRGGDCPNDEREGAEHHEGEGPEGAAGAEPKKEVKGVGGREVEEGSGGGGGGGGETGGEKEEGFTLASLRNVEGVGFARRLLVRQEARERERMLGKGREDWRTEGEEEAAPGRRGDGGEEKTPFCPNAMDSPPIVPITPIALAEHPTHRPRDPPAGGTEERERGSEAGCVPRAEVHIPRVHFYGEETTLGAGPGAGSLLPSEGGGEGGKEVERTEGWRAGRPLTRIESLREKIRQREREREREKKREGGEVEKSGTGEGEAEKEEREGERRLQAGEGEGEVEEGGMVEEERVEPLRHVTQEQEVAVPKPGPRLPASVERAAFSSEAAAAAAAGERSSAPPPSPGVQGPAGEQVQGAAADGSPQDSAEETERESEGDGGERDRQPRYLPPSLSPSPARSLSPPSLVHMSRIYSFAAAGCRGAASYGGRRAEPVGRGAEPEEEGVGPGAAGQGAVQAGSGGGVAAVQKQVELLHLREQEGGRAPLHPGRKGRGEAQPAPHAHRTSQNPPQTQLHSRGTQPRQPAPLSQPQPPRSFTVTPRPEPPSPKNPPQAAPTGPSPPLFSLRTSGGTQGKRGNTITITPRKTPAGPGAVRTGPAPSPAPAPTPNGTAAAPGDGGRKRYPTAEEIQVIGGYERLDRSCLVKQSRRHKGVKVCFDETQLERFCEYPSESSMMACFPCPAQPNPERENRAREGEDDEEDEEEEGGVFTSGSVRITGPEASRMLRVDESCRR
ncbi:phostensin-like [Anguilla rostrata]|uniref:phostensin-like n=1 Tax=Anguilla rostrata TaxID=7938 RepID=UPI0030CD989A